MSTTTSLDRRLRAACGLAMCAVFLLGADAGAGDLDAPRADLVVHEWGTFLSVQGSDGVSVGGVVESEELLPEFVLFHLDDAAQWRSWIRQKMETPVTYFYTPEPMAVRVRVDMPRGLLTHWFPAVRSFGNLEPAPGTPAVPAHYDAGRQGTFLDWGRIELLPDPGPGARGAAGLIPPGVDPEGTWEYARETDAAFVKVHAGDRRDLERHVHEKFLFYRGLGAFDLPLAVRSGAGVGGLTLTFENSAGEALAGALLLEVKDGALRFARLAELPEGDTTTTIESVLGDPLPLDEGVARVRETLLETLVDAGLYCREAEAMLATWEESYFRSAGLRVLYLLPRSLVDATIPLAIDPRPREIVRVMLARAELLTPGAEATIASAIEDLGAADARTRREAQQRITALGRLLEPALRRVIQIADNRSAVHDRARKLLRHLIARGIDG